MASPNLYVRSTDGSDADNGTTWALAKATGAGAAAIDSTTDNHIWFSSSHSESTTGANQAWTFAGTAAAPTWAVCVDDTGSPEPPTALTTGAVITTTGAYGVNINGYVYLYGLRFNIGTGSVNVNVAFDSSSVGATQIAEACIFDIVGTGANAGITMSAAANAQPTKVIWKSCDVKFGAPVQFIKPVLANFTWSGGSVLSGSAALTSGLIAPNGNGESSKSLVEGVDLTNVGVTGYLVGKSAGGVLDVVFRNCPVPAWTTGGLRTGTLQPGDRVGMYNCDSADTNYRLWIDDYFGVITSETGIYNDAGADDGSAQGFSWKMVSNSLSEFPHQTLCSDEIVRWNDTVTGTITIAVEIVHDSQGSGTNGALLDSEIWIEVLYSGTTGSSDGTFISDRCGNLNLNSNAADQASSSAAWTGDSAGWDTQKLSVSFDPKEKGYIHAKVHLAKASATVYVDPLITVS